MNYTHRLTVLIPTDLVSIANNLARVIGPDAEEDENFSSVFAGPNISTKTHVVADMIIRPELAGQIPYMRASAAVLHGAVAQGYAARFPSLPVPTLADCQQFIDHALIRCEPRDDSVSLADLLPQAFGLVLIPPPPIEI